MSLALLPALGLEVTLQIGVMRWPVLCPVMLYSRVISGCPQGLELSHVSQKEDDHFNQHSESL